MSHFAVLAVVPEGKALEDVMLPYHEYECTGIKKYLQFVPCDQEEFLQEYKEHGDGQSLVEFAKDWGGYVFDPESQMWGRITNPNKKWDWYEIGGRWDKVLGKNEGAKSSFNFLEIRAGRLAKALATRSDWILAREAARPTQKDIDAAIKTMSDHWSKHEPALKLYADPLDLALDSIAFRAIDFRVWGCDNAEEFRLPAEEYAARKTWAGLTHAFIGLDGKWNERGDMGWWGMCSDENKSQYDGEHGIFWEFLKSLPDNTMLYVVDCHV